MTPSNFIVVHTAAGIHDAQIVAGLLKSEGIPARVPGEELTDEFAMSRKLSGPVEIVVPEENAREAADIVAAWKERGNGPPSE